MGPVIVPPALGNIVFAKSLAALASFTAFSAVD
jgi:hypothetical protein